MASPSIIFLLMLMNFLMNLKTFFFIKLHTADFTFEGQNFHYIFTIRKVLLVKVCPIHEFGFVWNRFGYKWIFFNHIVYVNNFSSYFESQYDNANLNWSGLV